MEEFQKSTAESLNRLQNATAVIQDATAVIQDVTAVIPYLLSKSVESENFWSASKLSVDRDTTFRKRLKRQLGYARDDEVRCMVTGILGGGSEVIAAHIIPRATEPRLLRVFDMKKEDLNDCRNGLFLTANIEKAFDKLELSFVKSENPLEISLRLKIWDDKCKSIPLFSGCARTIGEYDGAVLNLSSKNGAGVSHRPFKRGLSYQAYHAHLNYCSELPQELVLYGSPEDACAFNFLFSDMRRQVVKSVEEDLHEANGSESDSDGGTGSDGDGDGDSDGGDSAVLDGEDEEGGVKIQSAGLSQPHNY